MSRNVSPARQIVHVLGTLLMVVGFISFASVFVTLGLDEYQGRTPSFREPRSEPLRAFGGMIVIAIGGILRAVGAQGIHGSGLVLDPKRARRELEPHSRQVGGMIGDALDEAGIVIGAPEAPPVERVVMIRCTSCETLNEDGSKFCQECGAKL